MAADSEKNLFRGYRYVLVWIVLAASIWSLTSACGGGSGQGSSSSDPTPETSLLSLTAPELEGELISGMPRQFQIGYSFDPVLLQEGAFDLRFVLRKGPSDLFLDAETGWMSWTPSPAIEGSRSEVAVEATLGRAKAEVSFTLPVALSVPVATAVRNNVVTVTQPGTLQGLEIAIPEQASLPASQVEVRIVNQTSAPPLPAGVVRVSDFFRVSPLTTDGGAIYLSLPSHFAPPGLQVEDLSLFTYEEGFEFGASDPDLDSGTRQSASWAPVGFDFMIAADALRFEVGELGALSFIGYYPFPDGLDGIVPEWGAEVRPLTSVEPLVVERRCARVSSTDAGTAIWNCEADGFRLQIRKIAPMNWRAGVTPDDVLGWALASRGKIRSLGMDVDTGIRVLIGPLENALGRWMASSPQTLLVSNELPTQGNLTRADVAKHVLAHEFFHHAQYRTRVDGREHMMEKLKGNVVWAIEGTAVWFEDELYDDSNRYRSRVSTGVPAFLASETGGLGFTSNKSEYQYFTWWKMLRNRCSGFSVRDIINVEPGDGRGVRSLANRINSPAWGCDFRPGFMESAELPERRFASALLYYAYATDVDTARRQNSLALLDPNEPPIQFREVVGTRLVPSDKCGPIRQGWFVTCPEPSRAARKVTAASVDKVVLRAPPESAPAPIVKVRNKHDTRDLYVYFARTSGEGAGWPTGEGGVLPPREEVTLPYGVVDRYRGAMTVFVVNPAQETGEYSIAVGLASPLVRFDRIDCVLTAAGREVTARGKAGNASPGAKLSILDGLGWQRDASGLKFPPAISCADWSTDLLDPASCRMAPGDPPETFWSVTIPPTVSIIGQLEISLTDADSHMVSPICPGTWEPTLEDRVFDGDRYNF